MSEKKKNISLFPHKPEPRVSRLNIKDRDKKDSYQGFVHLVFLLLGAASFQLTIKNYLKHGVIADFSIIRKCLFSDTLITSISIMGVSCLSIVMFYIIQLQTTKKISKTISLILYFIVQAILYIVPFVVIIKLNMAPLSGGLITCNIIVVSLKCHSFFSTCNLLLSNEGFAKEMHLHLTLKHYLYFQAAPTLVYETSFPRNEKVRYWWAIKEFIQAVLCVLTSYHLLVQFMIPILQEDENNSVLYDIIRLSIPSLISWLLGFYAFFHCFLNCCAEILGYADRQFYLDWWNAESLDVFWRKWNIQVHEWLLRHVYLETIRTHKKSKGVAAILVFLFSAIYHELIFCVAFRIIRPWFFLGMFAQIPLIFLSKWIVSVLDEHHRHRWGNVFVWFCLFVGQPLIEILYIREWFKKTNSLFCIESDTEIEFGYWF